VPLQTVTGFCASLSPMKSRWKILYTLAFMALGSPVMAIEEPRYELEQRDGDMELRRYAPHLLAETLVDGSFDEAGNAAFQRLFRYINGNNRGERRIAMTSPVVQQDASGSKIAMTAPVRQEGNATGGFRVAFVVPAAFSRATVPEPNDPLVVIREVPGQRMAVLRYSGRWTEENYRKHETLLRKWIADQGLAATGPPVYARYNAPFVPWPMRRNEVMVPVAPSTLPR
jgi:effector-binding domain-containing protein